MKQKTAIDWLIDKYFGGINNCTPDFKYHIKQAKQKEKEQIIDAYKDAYHTASSFDCDAEEYYNQTYLDESK